MTMPAVRTIALLAAVLLAACAPDAVKPSPGYQGFLTQVQNACYYQRIGVVNVGDILTNPGNMQATYFVDMTSRLYFGKITRQNWIDGVTSFIQGRASDSGVQCVLDQLDKAPRPAAPQDLMAPPKG